MSVLRYRRAAATLELAASVVVMSFIGWQIHFKLSWGFVAFARIWRLFTYWSCSLTAIVLLMSSLAIWLGRRSAKIDYLRSMMTFYMVIVAAVSATLLSGLHDLAPLNITLHIAIPAVVVVIYTLDPPHATYSLRQISGWFVFPVAYVLFATIYGRSTGEAIYPFLDGAWLSIAITMGCIALFAAVAALVLNRYGSIARRISLYSS